MTNEKKNNISELSEILSQNFLRVDPGFIIGSADAKNLDDLKKFLSSEIRKLLHTKFDSLINILYRIDIDEAKINKIFSHKDKEGIPEALAGLIIERQLQKISYRKIYKEGKI